MNNRTANFATPLLTYVLIAACVGGFLLQNTDPERWIIAGALCSTRMVLPLGSIAR